MTLPPPVPPDPALPDPALPDPALIVLVGPSGSGKSTWAAARFRSAEVVSSDQLRNVVGSGAHDLDASDDAFALLDMIVAGRLRRGLTVVVDTLGFDQARRLAQRDQARQAGMPAVAVLFDTSAAECRRRNRLRDRPVPAAVLTGQLRRMTALTAEIDAEGWEVVARTGGEPAPASGRSEPVPASPGEQVALSGADSVPADWAEPTPSSGAAERARQADRPPRSGPAPAALELVLQVSRFPWRDDPPGWLAAVAAAAAEAGLTGIALMDHLIQIPQVDRAWEPIPEPWVSLGMLAGLVPDLRLGTLVTPVTFRAPGILAKAVATLDVLSGGRAFCGIGAGWWEREHSAFGLQFPPAAARLDQLEAAIETMRALWQPGTKPYRGSRVWLPETTCYPRPVSAIPIIVGGSGDRTLKIAARMADGCNLPSDEPVLERKLAVLREHCRSVGRRIGREDGGLRVTVLDVPVIGRDREHVAAIVETARGRSSAAAYARQHHAGLARDHAERYRRLAGLGVSTVFVALPDLAGPDDVLRLGPLAAALG